MKSIALIATRALIICLGATVSGTRCASQEVYKKFGLQLNAAYQDLNYELSNSYNTFLHFLSRSYRNPQYAILGVYHRNDFCKNVHQRGYTTIFLITPQSDNATSVVKYWIDQDNSKAALINAAIKSGISTIDTMFPHGSVNIQSKMVPYISTRQQIVELKKAINERDITLESQDSVLLTLDECSSKISVCFEVGFTRAVVLGDYLEHSGAMEKIKNILELAWSDFDKSKR